MTTLIALATRDALVMGCDSLGTVTRRLLDPFDLAEYFDPDNRFKAKLNPNGQPLLDDFSKIYLKSQHIPYDHMTHVDKLLPLSPPEMGVMFSGEMAVGDRTIKSLIAEFKSTSTIFKGNDTNYTLKSVGNRLLKFLWPIYLQQHPDEHTRPELELMLGGYDKRRPTPGVIRLFLHENKIEDPDYDFGLYFGGQFKEIERLIRGTDFANGIRLIKRTEELLKRYHTLLTQQLEANGTRLDLKTPDEFGDELHLFHDWDLEGLPARYGAFSEQNAIECVDFLVNIMIRSQQFSTQMPTVGGEVQVAVIKKGSGFNFVSRREWRHHDHAIPAKD